MSLSEVTRALMARYQLRLWEEASPRFATLGAGVGVLAAEHGTGDDHFQWSALHAGGGVPAHLAA